MIDWRSAALIYLIVLVVWIGTDAAMGRHAEFFNSYELILQLAGGGHAGRPFIVGQAALGAWAWLLAAAILLLLPALAAVLGLAALRLHEWKRAHGGWFATRRRDGRPPPPGRRRREDAGPDDAAR
jgi:hypothetical protein